MAETESLPIVENEQVKALLALLKDNNAAGYSEFSSLIGHVTEMEQRLFEATQELKAMRQEMQNHSLKGSLQKTYKALEANAAVMGQRLFKLKEQIIGGCKNILTDFKERGAVALDGITQFLHLRPALESIQKVAENSIQSSDRATARIDAFSAEYHEAGQHLKNMGRTLRGKPAKQDIKESGKIAGALKAVIYKERSCVSTIKDSAERSLETLDRLAQIAQRRPSVLKTMREQAAKTEPIKSQAVKANDIEGR